jgi:hypothetical protein
MPFPEMGRGCKRNPGLELVLVACTTEYTDERVDERMPCGARIAAEIDVILMMNSCKDEMPSQEVVRKSKQHDYKGIFYFTVS